MITVPIPGTDMLLTIRDEKLCTPEVEAWLREVAASIAPEARAQLAAARRTLDDLIVFGTAEIP